MSHDLRAPFRHIVGYTQLLRDREQSLSAQSLHYLDSINEAAVSAGQLVDDLLSFSQLGRTALSVMPVDMHKVVQEIVRSVEPDVRGRQIEWRIQPLPPTNGDAALLRQALYNLVDNALKYSRDRARLRSSRSAVNNLRRSAFTQCATTESVSTWRTRTNYLACSNGCIAWKTLPVPASAWH